MLLVPSLVSLYFKTPSFPRRISILLKTVPNIRASRHLNVASCSSTLLKWEPSRFKGATVHVEAVTDEFELQLRNTMTVIKADERKGIWMRVPIQHSAAIAIAHSHGFQYHHAEGDTAMLLNWLPKDEPCPVPPFATHIIGMASPLFQACLISSTGVGGLVIRGNGDVLCVREANSPTGEWGKTSTAWVLLQRAAP